MKKNLFALIANQYSELMKKKAMTKIEYLCGLEPKDISGMEYYDAIELKIVKAKELISKESDKPYFIRDFHRLKLIIEEMEINKEILRER